MWAAKRGLRGGARRAAGLLVSCWFMATIGVSAHAQTPAEKAQAQVLFDEARALMGKDETAVACDKFAQSYQLDPALGTQLNLAVCYEKLGKTASAWITFQEVATKARRAGQQRRTEFASQHAEALAGTLSRLRVEVIEPVDGLVVERDGEPLAEGIWGSFVPVDPGVHVISAKAPGKEPWRTEVAVGQQADRAEVTVPALAEAPVADGGTDVAPAPSEPSGADTGLATPVVLGWAALGTGVAGGAVGVVLRVMALGKDSDSRDHCLPDDPLVCTQEGQDLRDEAQALELGSTVAWAAGGALVLTGVLLLVLAPDDDEATSARFEWLPLAAPDGAALGARWRW